MFKKTIVAGALILTASANAQLRVGIESNSQYYNNDNRIKIDTLEAKKPFRSNNYVKLDYTLKNFEFGLQVEGYAPKAILNYNPDYKGVHVGHVFARYNNYEKGVDITAGHMYEQFGSGLALRFWEDRALGINNSLFGGRVKLNIGEGIQVKALGGKQRVGMGFDFSEGIVYGADFEADVTELKALEDYTFKVGATFVGKYEDLTKTLSSSYDPSDFVGFDKNTFIFGPRAEYVGENFNVQGEFLYKTKEVQFENFDYKTDVNRAGNAFLLNAGYTKGDFAVNLNLRRMENFALYSQRNMSGNQFNYGMINYIPALTKQYDHTLQNIFVYQAQPQMIYYQDGYEKQGEIGGQFDMFYEAPAGSTLGGERGASFAINGSYWAGLKNKISHYNVIDKWGGEEEKINLSSDIFGFGNKYYSDFAIEYRKPMSDRLNTIFSYLNQFYNSKYIMIKDYAVNAHTIAAEGTYFLTDTKSVRLELQHQWASADRRNWAGGTLEYIPSKKWSFFVHDIYNYGTKKEAEKMHYYSFGGAFTKGATRIAATYGRQRGGMICVGGVCRMVPESAGFTLNITTNF
ncbi:DUF6029 family protein [Capnocytophaga sp. ARDL2]|uniref:DUF6029 family protein n=1 Tax=Capnocytophaga sp. ARDL2 TaxID=3238809 RepID=UPI003558676A